MRGFSLAPYLPRAVSCSLPRVFSTDWVSEDKPHGGFPIALRVESPLPPLVSVYVDLRSTFCPYDSDALHFSLAFLG